MRVEGGSDESVSRHDGLLGTVVDIRIRCDDSAIGAAAHTSIVDEISRLEAVFSIHDEHSELSRWKRDEVPSPSPEFVHVMSAALEWQRRSHGAFNPMSGILSQIWRRAEDDGTVPGPRVLRDAARSIEDPRFVVLDGEVRRLDDCSALNLNALAKGYIVDQACAVAVDRFDISTALVAAGGDMVHHGERPARVGIENPLRPYDNEAPLVVIELAGSGLATSGGSRRGFRIDGMRFSHVVDPRTGRPVTGQASITVVAGTAMDADGLATTLGMTDPLDAIVASEQHQGCACLVIGVDGSRSANAQWLRAFGSPSPTTSG